MNAPRTIGRYEVLDAITSGGMGSIYLARDPKIGNRRVAIKLMREGYDTPDMRERFGREADAAGALHHANIVTIFDVGEFDGQPFIAMEFIQGETIKDLIRSGRQLSLTRKIELMIELCAGLTYAHRAGIVHRDIKPANVMVDQDGTLKILDFGIARVSTSGMTRTGSVIGTLNYMAPEQMAGQTVDPRADMFSAGALFYELLSGKMAFPGDLPSIVHTIMTADRTPLLRLVPDLDPGLVAIVDRCLERDPAARFPDMASVRKDLVSLRQRINADERENVQALTDQAAGALARGEFEAALALCDEALVLDPEHAAILDVRQRARDGRDRQRVRGWTLEARRDIDRNALTAAALLIDRALALDPASEDALAAFGALVAARRHVAEAVELARRAASIVDRAEEHLDAGALEDARSSLDEAQALAPPDARAIAVRERLNTAFNQRRRTEEARREAARMAAVRSAVEAARRRSRAGDYAGAIQDLKAYEPSSPEVSDALVALLAEAQEVERQRALDDRRRLDDERRQQDAARQDEEERLRRSSRERTGPDTAERERLAREEAERRLLGMLETPFNDAPAPFEPPRPPSLPESSVFTQTVAPPQVVEETARLSPPAQAERPAAPLAEQRRPPVVAPHRPSLPAWKAIAAGAVVLVLAVGAVVFVRSSRRQTPPPGGTSDGAGAVTESSVQFDVAPWARIDAIVRASDGQRVDGADLVTPVTVRLSPGSYHVRASNPAFAPLEFDITVDSAPLQVVRRQMPGFDAEREIADILGK